MQQAASLVALSQQVMENTARFLDIKDEIREHRNRLDVFEAKTNAVIEKTGYYSVIAYANLKKVCLPREEAARLGKLAAKISKEKGVPTSSVPDERWGKVGTYHYRVLDEVFQDN